MIALASVIITPMRSGCGVPEPHMAGTTDHDPVEFAKPFTAVCKVGQRGGDGTLIDKAWVLSAGHVADGMHQRTAGALNVYFENGAVVPVKQVFLHPKYAPMGPYDLALLQLVQEVPDIAPTACYANSDELGRTIILAGHGDKRNADGSWIRDGRLRAYTNVVDAVNDTHLVFDYDAPGGDATEQEGTSGPGDSGGPAFIRTEAGYLVAGVSSMGEPGADGPCSYGAIEHFVRVSQFIPWITDVMQRPEAHQALGMAQDLDVRSSGEALGDTPAERAAQRIVSALGSGDDALVIAAIEATYDPAILAKRDARTIAANMPALLQQLRGARLVGVRSVSEARASLEMENEGLRYGLDLFLRPSGKVEQMAFGRLE